MREIKFRAWHKKTSHPRMYGVAYLYSERNGALYVVITDDEREMAIGNLLVGDEVELMQYTGLKDRQGKEIYEGDIVKCTDGYNATVSYDEVKAEFNPFGGGESAEWGSGVEIIGNRYENPELLEAK